MLSQIEMWEYIAEDACLLPEEMKRCLVDLVRFNRTKFLKFHPLRVSKREFKIKLNEKDYFFRNGVCRYFYIDAKKSDA